MALAVLVIGSQQRGIVVRKHREKEYVYDRTCRSEYGDTESYLSVQKAMNEREKHASRVMSHACTTSNIFVTPRQELEYPTKANYPSLQRLLPVPLQTTLNIAK